MFSIVSKRCNLYLPEVDSIINEYLMEDKNNIKRKMRCVLNELKLHFMIKEYEKYEDVVERDFDFEYFEYLIRNYISPKLALRLVKINGVLLKFIESQTPEIIEEAVKNDERAFRHVRKQTEEMCIKMIIKHPKVFRYVENKTPYMCRLAVRVRRCNIEYIDDKDILCQLVKDDWTLLRLIKKSKQAEEMCLTAINQNGMAINYCSKKILKNLITSQVIKIQQS